VHSLTVIRNLFAFSNIAAMSQAETQKWFESLKQEVEKRDADIRQLQRSLKESEGLLVSISPSFLLHLVFSIVSIQYDLSLPQSKQTCSELHKVDCKPWSLSVSTGIQQ